MISGSRPEVVQDGEYRGGPAYYIRHGLGSRAFAAVFAWEFDFTRGQKPAVG